MSEKYRYAIARASAGLCPECEKPILNGQRVRILANRMIHATCGKVCNPKITAAFRAKQNPFEHLTTTKRKDILKSCDEQNKQYRASTNSEGPHTGEYTELNSETASRSTDR